MDVSFIIPLYNQVAYTRQIWADLPLTLPDDLAWEIIFVDDGSSDETQAFLASINDPRVTVLRNEPNRGFAGANNRGVEHAQGRFLGLLNNDLILKPGWFEPILELLAQDGVGGVGNVQYNPATGLIDHAGVYFDLDGLPGHVLKNRRTYPKGDYAEWNAVTAACFFLSRELYLELGGFDEAFENGMEDIDLCVRIRRHGLRLLVAHRSVIGHCVSVSRRKSTDRERRNTERFLLRCAETTRPWGQAEWPREYLRCHARKWWRLNLFKTLRALRMIFSEAGKVSQ
ncbi:glycosyltransferase family 2 protein [Cerasicoccus frondis]|uniref:glycosyltransferase family 2 protein n=1 Tax=Cerasicoccus frondis TaxID=490090 RepID=UPI002852BF4E|nr:glycosyltransferase family 2 protein [Cerasicoccus frondis]